MKHLAELAVGLHQAEPRRRIDLDQLGGAGGPDPHQRASPGERADLAGELARPLDRDRALDPVGRSHDLELALDHGEERNLAVALLDQDLCGAQAPAPAVGLDAGQLRLGQPGEHLIDAGGQAQRVRGGAHGDLRRRA